MHNRKTLKLPNIMCKTVESAKGITEENFSIALSSYTCKKLTLKIEHATFTLSGSNM